MQGRRYRVAPAPSAGLETEMSDAPEETGVAAPITRALHTHFHGIRPFALDGIAGYTPGIFFVGTASSFDHSPFPSLTTDGGVDAQSTFPNVPTRIAVPSYPPLPPRATATFRNLPSHIQVAIFDHLSASDILNYRLTNKSVLTNHVIRRLMSEHLHTARSELQCLLLIANKLRHQTADRQLLTLLVGLLNIDSERRRLLTTELPLPGSNLFVAPMYPERLRANIRELYKRFDRYGKDLLYLEASNLFPNRVERLRSNLAYTYAFSTLSLLAGLALASTSVWYTTTHKSVNTSLATALFSLAGVFLGLSALCFISAKIANRCIGRHVAAAHMNNLTRLGCMRETQDAIQKLAPLTEGLRPFQRTYEYQADVPRVHTDFGAGAILPV